MDLSSLIMFCGVGKKDEDAQGIIDFNDKVHLDKRVDNVLFPIRDGLMVLRKL